MGRRQPFTRSFLWLGEVADFGRAILPLFLPPLYSLNCLRQCLPLLGVVSLGVVSLGVVGWLGGCLDASSTSFLLLG